MGVLWDPFGDLRSTKKFVFELLMASVDLDVLFFFSCLLFCSCFSSFGVVIFRVIQDLLTVSTNLLVWCWKSMNVNCQTNINKDYDMKTQHNNTCKNDYDSYV